MLTVSYSGQFKKDVGKSKKQGKDVNKLKHIIEMLIDRETLPQRLKDHPLKGNWKNYRDLHIESDWVLIYKIEDTSIHFERTGTHSDLF